MTVSISKANAFSTSKPDYSAIRAILNNSKIQTTNNPLWQSIVNLITAGESTQATQTSFAETIDNVVSALQTQVTALGVITLVEADTSTTPQTVVLATAVSGYTIIKDISGNAAANNITLTGTLDGVVNPVLNTNYVAQRVYGTGPFFSW